MDVYQDSIPEEGGQDTSLDELAIGRLPDIVVHYSLELPIEAQSKVYVDHFSL